MALVISVLVVIIAAVLLRTKWQAKRINDYFCNAVRVFAFTGDQDARSALVAAAKIAAAAQRDSMVASVGGWEGLKEARESGHRVKSDERILGRSEFVERVLREAGEQWERRSRLRRRGANLSLFIEKVAVGFGVGTNDLKSGSRSRKVAKARAALCYIAVRELGLSCASVAKELRISPSAVSGGARTQ